MEEKTEDREEIIEILSPERQKEFEKISKMCRNDVNRMLMMPYMTKELLDIGRKVMEAASDGDETTDFQQSLEMMNKIFRPETQEAVAEYFMEDEDPEAAWKFYIESGVGKFMPSVGGR